MDNLRRIYQAFKDARDYGSDATLAGWALLNAPVIFSRFDEEDAREAARRALPTPELVQHIKTRLKAHGYESYQKCYRKRKGKLRFSHDEAWRWNDYGVHWGGEDIYNAIRAGQDFGWLNKPTPDEKRLLIEAKEACAETQKRLNLEEEARLAAEAESIASRAMACGFTHIRSHTQRREMVLLRKATRRSAHLDSWAGRGCIVSAILDGQNFEAIFAPLEA